MKSLRRRPFNASDFDPQVVARVLGILSSCGCTALVSKDVLITDAPEHWVRVAIEAVLVMRERERRAGLP